MDSVGSVLRWGTTIKVLGKVFHIGSEIKGISKQILSFVYSVYAHCI